MKTLLVSYFTLLFTCLSFSQNTIDLKAYFDITKHSIKINQTITYYNQSQDTLKSIFLNDWNNSYSGKKTALAKRLADEYINKFHLAKKEERGFTTIKSIKQNNNTLEYSRLKNKIDVIKVILNTPLIPKASYTINLEYSVKIPSDKFTNYGITPTNDANLRYWYIQPAIYNGTWQHYSNKALDDLYIPKSNTTLELTYPKDYTATSALNTMSSSIKDSLKTTILTGKNVINSKLFLNKTPEYHTLKTKDVNIITDIKARKKSKPIDKAALAKKITTFVTNNFGKYPHKNILVTHIDHDKDPVYALNFLPDFIQPYSDSFKYELKLLKLVIHNHLENTLLTNPRKDYWLLDGIEIFYIMKYVETHYPDMKFLGAFANFWGIRSFHASKLKYNDKNNFAYMIMARTNRDQPLSMPKDSLIKFNKNIAGKYKAGLGLRYLNDFTGNNIVDTAVSTFLKNNQLKETSTTAFETHLKAQTDKSIDWFFKDYIGTREKIDFKIKKVKKTKDSITLTIKNKRNNNMPIALYALKNDSIISKNWIENINKQKTITIPKGETNKLALNYNNIAPEFNLRDNWKSLKGLFFNNKPLQFKLFEDVENPYYNQIFLIPVGEFNNIYDGLTLGVKLFNTTLLRKKLFYKIEPKYSLKSKSLTGSVAAAFTHNLDHSNLYRINYGVRAGYQSFAEDLFVKQLTPSLRFDFRQKNDFRSNKRASLLFRYIVTERDEDPLNVANITEPDYSILNARYIKSNDNLINFSKWFTDLQIAKDFTKLSLNYEYRRLFNSNRQLNVRAFSGVFLRNETETNSDFFSFALDRPTDYLFDFPYLGRSDDSGIFTQQFIAAEGGFKSKLNTPFANQWLSTLNVSTTLWRYILAYGDVGVVKNKFNAPNFVYDSGVRINLVTDYFELYFPIYSNLGWEIAQPKYGEKIRFQITLDPQVLLGLFKRKWF